MVVVIEGPSTVLEPSLDAVNAAAVAAEAYAVSQLDALGVTTARTSGRWRAPLPVCWYDGEDVRRLQARMVEHVVLLDHGRGG